ncbi:hypothetical protein D3C85_646020 [compost metagenome]
MKVAVITGARVAMSVSLAIALAAVQGPAVLPTRRPDLEPGFDMNDSLDLDDRRRRRAARKQHLKAAGQRAMAKE